MTRIIAPNTQYSDLHIITSVTALSLIYKLYSSPLPAHKCSQSSLVVSWQWIYNSLAVNAAHYKVYFTQPNFFLAISSQFFCQLRNSVLFPAAWDPRYTALGRIHRKHRLSTVVLLLGVVAETCLPSSCLAMDVSSEFTIPASGRHVTIYNVYTVYTIYIFTPPLCSSGQSSWLQIQRSRLRFPALPDFLRSSGSGMGSTQACEDNWGATWMKK
jgi:hypothetical protein